MAERRKKKLAYFQKTWSGIVKKGDTTKASIPVNSPFTLGELVHMINVSVNSKYGADLEGITHTIMDKVRDSLELVRLESKRESKGLPRQIRAVVQQVLGEARDKHDTEAVDISTGVSSSAETPFCLPGSTARQINLGACLTPISSNLIIRCMPTGRVDIPWQGCMVPDRLFQ
jgi:hypothetical protein